MVKRFSRKLQREDGNVLITAFIFLVILTLIGIFATRTAQMDIQIAANEIPYRQNFYLAEAALYREAAELGRGNYAVTNIHAPDTLASRAGGVSDPDPLPGADHEVFDQTYDFEVEYVGFFLPPAGFDAADYARHDYTVDVTANNVRVVSRLYRIGPKVE